ARGPGPASRRRGAVNISPPRALSAVWCYVLGVSDVAQFIPSMWPQLSSPLEHFFLFLSLLLLSWCALDLAAHILVASASEVASHFTRPVTISAPVYRALASL